MIFTSRGAEKEIDRLLDRLEDLKAGLEGFDNDNKDSAALGLETSDVDEMVGRLQVGCFKMRSDLRNAKLQIMTSVSPWRDTLPLLKICKKEISMLESFLDQSERISDAVSRMQ